jgi:hypothetical protein
VTRKDYIVIANAIRNFRTFLSDDNDYLLLVNLFCSDLKHDNPRFDRTKFMNACGL